MEIKSYGVKGKCMANGCKEDAKYEIVLKRSLLGGSILLCENCLREMYVSVGNVLIPKSPENIIKKKMEVKNK